MLEHLMTVQMKYKYSGHLIEILGKVQHLSLIIWDRLPKLVYKCEDETQITKTIVEFNEKQLLVCALFFSDAC